MPKRKLKTVGSSELTQYLKGLEDLERPSTPKEVERAGKVFKRGNPTIECYHWPSDDLRSFEKAFLNSIDDLSKLLLDKAKEEFVTFEISRQAYPRLVRYDKAIEIHLGDGGRWVDFDAGSSAGVIGDAHNLDWPSDKVVAFNLTSKFVEALDLEIKAPQIYKDSIVYWLPKDFSTLPEDGIISNKEYLSKMHEFYGLGKLKNVAIEKESQRIEGEHGCVTIEKGVCTATGFNQSYFPGVTCLMALLVDSCHFGRT